MFLSAIKKDKAGLSFCLTFKFLDWSAFHLFCAESKLFELLFFMDVGVSECA